MVLKYNTFSLIWALVILGLTLLTGQTHSNMGVSLLDKGVHSFLFCVLSFLLIVGFLKQSEYTFVHFNAISAAIVISVVYGVAIECLQLVVPGRFFDWFDMLANAFGAVVGYGLFFLVYKL